jgi:hypothetical protein
MDQEMKQKWIDALRGGNYLQNQGCLKAEVYEGKIGYCCLGVLCDLVDPDAWSNVTDGWDRFAFGVTESTVYPPDSIKEKFDLRKDIVIDLGKGDVRIKKVYDFLADMNDEGKTFEEIADWIEENL